MTDEKQVSEQWMERYAAEHGLDGWQERHPELGQEGPHPDYRLTREEHSAICEVKQFETQWLTERLNHGGPVTTGPEQSYTTVRNAVSDAAKRQLRPYRDRAEPLVIVLANPRGADVPLEDPQEVLLALYGDPTVQMPVGPGAEQAGPMRQVYGRGGALSQDHPYVSAVLTLHQRTHAADYWDAWGDRNRNKWEGIEDRREAMTVVLEEHEAEAARGQVPEGDYVFVRVFETKSSVEGEAAALSAEMFNGRHDQRWTYDPDTGAWTLDAKPEKSSSPR